MVSKRGGNLDKAMSQILGRQEKIREAAKQEKRDQGLDTGSEKSVVSGDFRKSLAMRRSKTGAYSKVLNKIREKLGMDVPKSFGGVQGYVKLYTERKRSLQTLKAMNSDQIVE